MFLASEAFSYFDYLRIPYRVQAGASVAAPNGFGVAASVAAPERWLMWPRASGEAIRGSAVAGEYRFGDSPIFAHVLPDGAMGTILGAGWRATDAVPDRLGQPFASVWRSETGSVCLPFDPDQAMVAFWSESYHSLGNGRMSHGPSRKLRLFYRLRPFMPRQLQIALRRQYARLWTRREFPRWPAEPALHDLLRNLYTLTAEVAGERPPWIAPWPAPFHWAMVLTHDVETAAGYGRIGEVMAIESTMGYRSAWNFVPRRYTVRDETVREITAAGGEVGLHGLYHDGRDLVSEHMLRARLPEMQEHAARWGAVGFRSPATQRRWDLMPMLGFDYDSSYPDTDPYEPQPGGSCAWLPYCVGGMVELPITLAQDHTLFTILRHPNADAWLDKAALLRQRGGMALMLTHPDYLGDETARGAYREVLETYADDGTAWKALPREVSAWWRRRDASQVVCENGEWRVRGPAENEATIERAPPR